ncbi:uncharacterized protein LOC143212563 [Lasioglossum baleicum]|uniref:uncharacterized protein LOC143212563 n=1 Tax=Lasioglossum baleicum TaxID=434251 RepID=UPI003FCE5504
MGLKVWSVSLACRNSTLDRFEYYCDVILREIHNFQSNGVDRSINSLIRHVEDDDINEIYNLIDQRARGHVRIHEKFNNRQKIINIRRSRRSSNKKSKRNRLYRHPKLSYEDQSKLKDELQKEAINLNLGNALKRRVQATLNPSDRSYKFEFSSREPGKHGSIPKANSAANNRNKSTPESSTNLNEKYKTYETFENNKNPGSGIRNQQRTLDPEKQQQEKTYISIQDHQRDIEMTTSSDIPDYDPSKIPYVDVPDYSDIREESLDAEDRRLSKKKMAGTDVDPGAPDANSNRKNQDGEVSWMNDNGDSFKRKLEISQNDDSARKLGSNEDGGSTGEKSAIFDINEYRKPFNLDEFLKDDPIMKKLQLLGKETTALYGGNRKRAGLFNETESDNRSTERSGMPEEDKDDYLPKTYGN